ncbi:MAG TPA: MlaD family protein [Rhodospirillales bacterium]|nr:MlaD family protein [Rhodospirillales bacterium]
MTEESRSAAAPPDLPRALVAEKRRFSLIWLIPIVAAIAGAWLVYTTLSSRGPMISITMQTASGIEPGKTVIKYRDVQLGLVEDVSLSDDLQHVVVRARMNKEAENELRAETLFWVENARITAGGVSGLGTLLSGAYIGMRPGPGAPQRDFVALETPPVYQVDIPGKRFLLEADRLGSVSAGAPIFFRGIQVGSVLGHELDKDGKDIRIFAFVAAPYDAFIRRGSHFWNASGIDVSIGGAGVKVRTESLQSILIGGIAFDTPLEASASPVAEEGAEFPLFASFDSIAEAQFTIKVPFRVYFDGSVAGLEKGAPVVSMGLRLGEVTDVHLEVNPETLKVLIPVDLVLEPQRWQVRGERVANKEAMRKRMAAWIQRGLRAQLQTANLLTGQQQVALEVFDNADAASLTEQDGVPVIPSVPSETEQLTEKVQAFLNKLDKAPIAELVADLRNTVNDADRLLASPSLRKGIDGVGPLLDSLNRTSDAARATLDGAAATMQSANSAIGTDSALRYDVARLLKELTSTARSLRTLADFLETNPNALILGKPLPDSQ